MCLESEGLPGIAVLHVEFGNLACIHLLLLFPPPPVQLKVKREYRNGILALKCLGLEFIKVTSVHISLPGTTSHKDCLDNWRQGASTTVKPEPLGAFSPSSPWPCYPFIPSVHPMAPSVLPSPQFPGMRSSFCVSVTGRWLKILILLQRTWSDLSEGSNRKTNFSLPPVHWRSCQN